MRTAVQAMKYLSNEPIVFSMYRPTEITVDANGDRITARMEHCDHKGTKHIYSRGAWRCECGARLKGNE